MKIHGRYACETKSVIVTLFRPHDQLIRPTDHCTIALPPPSSSNFALPQLRSRFGERSCSHAGPSVWNTLPSDIRAVGGMTAFRQAVKTHYFSLAFSVF